eukprot:TRINITY_DN1651_c0_g1_i1.p1 TRINITY_DN1651_c0_g1~~TRINITY_DN1651_c0_g1_i1.p1  ORF type:complete len:594 (-),score=84.02 TRINITY_DN1651_c0_g1_i1:62-1843(-)
MKCIINAWLGIVCVLRTMSFILLTQTQKANNQSTLSFSTTMTLVGDCVRPPNDVIHSPYTDAKGQQSEYVVILNDNDPVWTETRHLHIKEAKDWIVSQVKIFTEQSRELQASGDVTKMMRLMPNYQMMKTKYSVHSKLYKQCLDYWTEHNLERIIDLEQILVTGEDENGREMGIPTDVMAIVRDPNVLITHKLRILMLLYATHPDQMKNRAHIEGANFDQASLTALDEWCYLVCRKFPREEQRRSPEDGEWKYKTSRFMPGVHDITTAVMDNSLPVDYFCCVDPVEADFIAESAPPPPPPAEEPLIDLSEVATEVAEITGEVTRFFSDLFGVEQPAPAPEPPKAEEPPLPPKPEQDAPENRSRITIFIVGGVSLNEIRAIHTLAKKTGRDILIGSTHIIEPNSFLEEVACLSMSIQNIVYSDTYIGDEVDEDRLQQEAQFGGPPKFGNGRKVVSSGPKNYGGAPAGMSAPARPQSGAAPPRPGGGYGGPPGGFGAQKNYGGQPSYGGQQGYGGQPSYGAPQPGYGAPQPAYGAPQPAYGAPQPAYGAPLPAYGAPQPAYGAPQPQGGFARGGARPMSQYGGRPVSQYGGWGQK